MELEIASGLQGSVYQPGDNIATPAYSSVSGTFAKQYCDGYIFLNYPQEVTVSKDEKLSYILEIKKATVNYAESYSSPKEFPADKPIPRLGLSIAELNLIGRFGLLRGKHDYNPGTSIFRGDDGPGYYLPLWTSLVVLLSMDDNTIVAGKKGSDGRVSAFAGLQYKDVRDDSLLRHLERVGIERKFVEPLLQNSWR